MPRAPKPPAYRRKLVGGIAYAAITIRNPETGERRDLYLGHCGSAESRRRYAQVVAEWTQDQSKWTQDQSD